MAESSITRRGFLKVGAGAGALVAIPLLLGSRVQKAEARQSRRGRGKGRRSRECKRVLKICLGFGVRGIEHTNDIPRRLACALTEMGVRNKQDPHSSKCCKTLRRAALVCIKKHRNTKNPEGKRKVILNLNELLDVIRGLDPSCLVAICTTVMFSTHGCLFPSTDQAHVAYRKLILKCKYLLWVKHVRAQSQLRAILDRKSLNRQLDEAFKQKSVLCKAYRKEVRSACRNILQGGHFSKKIISSVWIMSH